MSIIIVMLSSAVFGALITFLILRNRQNKSAQSEIDQLQQSLEQSQQALQDYRNQVSDHFQQSAGLFYQLTANYKAIYEHLSEGAVKLCDDAETLKTIQSSQASSLASTAELTPPLEIPDENLTNVDSSLCSKPKDPENTPPEDKKSGKETDSII
ncbi:MAG: YhcB family protein [Gammaproteobacteria bacterium]|nr:YhcB family protein [Gammaproteobacteria bacterium]MDH5728054.1 YhcB family protein [Gammaproteobacteria bacterium]